MKKLKYLLLKHRTLLVWLFTDPYLEDISNQELKAYIQLNFPRLYKRIVK